MGGLDAGEGKAPPKKSVGLRHPRRRVGVRIDMTPMVDIAFLLLIFFMVTTVFRAPQAMEVNRPPKDAKVEVAESNVMVMLVDKDERIFWRFGEEPLQSISKRDLARHFKEHLAANPKLTILIKLHREAKYEVMVDLMDELEYAKMTRFSLIPMSEEDAEEVMEMP
jgi:biopolymer transport protein ExbD